MAFVEQAHFEEAKAGSWTREQIPDWSRARRAWTYAL